MEFTVYSKYGCPYCDKIKFVLSQLPVNLTKYDLNEDFNSQEFYDKFGIGATFPQVVVDGKNIGGCSDTIKYLQRNNMV